MRSTDPPPESPTGPGDHRARNRAVKRQAFLDAARWIVTTDGDRALTMQRLASELDCGVGSIYRYFPSKGDLVAAVEREQLGALRASLAAGRERFDADVDPDAAGLSTPTLALARVLLVGRLWIAAMTGLPTEVRTARRLVVAPATRAAVAEVIDLLREPLDVAVALGALAVADNRARVQVLMAGVTDAVLADGAAVQGEQLLSCLVLAWGADPVELGRAGAAVGMVS